MKFSLNELSGSLGDLGTYLPLVIMLAKKNLIDINNVLFFSGFLNCITAFVWDIPMPVQPMKSIASVAITENELTKEQILTSGILIGGIVLIIGITKTIDKINKIVPKSVICGIQLGLGLNMSIKGISMITVKDLFVFDGLITGICLGIITFISFSFKRIPIALILVIIGIIYTVCIIPSNSYYFINPININTISKVTKDDWYYGFIRGTLPQLPLTILNSVISVCALSYNLFPDNVKVTRTSVASSVGLMNLLTCPFGGLPVCHGAGGLAGQYKFGARNGASILFLGLNKILLSLIFGNILIDILKSFPDSILGVLLFYSGLELAIKGSKTEVNYILLITTSIQMTTDTFIGCLSGCCLSLIEYIVNKYVINDLR